MGYDVIMEMQDITAQIEAQIAAEAKAPASALTPEARAVAEALEGAPKPEAKPDISRLPNALDGDGMPRFSVGDRIVIERRASFLAGNPYLDTRTYRVKRIDEGTGVMSLWDESMAQWATDNFIAGPINGQVYKLAGRASVSTKKKRGRPRKNPIEEPKPVVMGADGKPVKKKRGRPAGSKNRPKEEIKAEKAARREKRATK